MRTRQTEPWRTIKEFEPGYGWRWAVVSQLCKTWQKEGSMRLRIVETDKGSSVGLSKSWRNCTQRNHGTQRHSGLSIRRSPVPQCSFLNEVMTFAAVLIFAEHLVTLSDCRSDAKTSICTFNTCSMIRILWISKLIQPAEQISIRRNGSPSQAHGARRQTSAA